MIHCIGDSHVCVFSGSDAIDGPDILPFFRTCRLGPHTAYNIMKRANAIDGIIRTQARRGDMIMFCFGEIDCRVHLLKQSEAEQRPLKDVVQDCVQRYMALFLHMKSHGFLLLAWNVPPSSRTDVICGEYSTYGDGRTRNEISRMFNQYLRRSCDARGIKFISIFDQLLDADGLTNMNFYMDQIHLSQKVMPLILEELDQRNILKGFSRRPDAHQFTFMNIKGNDFSLRPEFLKTLKDTFGGTVFIETGTYYGNTTAKAAEIFPEVHTIELNEMLYQQAILRFKQNKNVFPHQGDSGELFPGLLTTMKKGRVIFWLDGHYSGAGTSKGLVFTPIIKELLAIKESGIRDAVILIDDIRNFDRPSPHRLASAAPDQGYPSLTRLCELVSTIDPAYQFAVIGDTLLAYPQQEGISVSPIVHACTISRLYDGGTIDDKKVLEAEETISCAEGYEQLHLQDLHRRFHGDEAHGYCRHYRLWHALTLFGGQAYTRAAKEFVAASAQGLEHWRVQWYLARSAYRSGDASMALQALAAVLRDKPDFGEAEDLLKRITSQGIPRPEVPFTADDRIDLALLYCKLQEPDLAAGHMQLALANSANQPSIHCRYAAGLTEIGQQDLAKAHLHQAILCDQLCSPAYNDLGVLYHQQGEFVKSLEMFGASFQADNKNYVALKNLLKLATTMSLTQQAATVLKEIMDSNGPNDELLAIAQEFVHLQRQ